MTDTQPASDETKQVTDDNNAPKLSNEDADISDEEDEDYVPTATLSEDEEDADLDIEPDEPTLVHTSRLTHAKRKAVDEAFASLFGTTPGLRESRSTVGEGKKKTAKKNKSSSSSRREKVLTDLFGHAEACKLLGTAKATVRVSERHAISRKEPLALYLPKQPVTELKKFAGRAVEARRVVTVAADNLSTVTGNLFKTAPDASISTTTKKSSSLDAVLREIAGPTKISTVEKTASDWEIFKDKTDLKDELETKAKGKDAYLEKKDFLQRVDVRQFDREKSQRDLQRSSKGR